MHARHRSPGGSNSLGFGLEKGSRNQGMYNSDYRGFNRGFGRGRPKPYPPRPRREDILMEAGRLAAEYLVSRGVLPPNSLPERLQNGGFQEFRGYERENPPEGGRTSALARLGNVVPERDIPFSGRRRFGDEYRMRGRRRGYGRGYGSDWNRDNSRPGFWSERVRGFAETMDNAGDFSSGYHQGEKRIESDVVGEVSRVVDEFLPPKNETTCDSQSDNENFDFPEQTGFRKDKAGLDVDLNKGFEPESPVSDVKDEGELRDAICGEEMEMNDVMEDFSSRGGQSAGNDLTRFCRLENVPTKTRSNMKSRGSKVDPGPINDSVPVSEEGSLSDFVPAKESKVSTEDESLEGSSVDSQMHLSHSSSVFASEISRVSSVRSISEVGEVDPSFEIDRERYMRSQSFSIGSLYLNQQESSGCPPGFGDGVGSRMYGRSTSMAQPRDKEGFVHNVGFREGIKRPRDWDSFKISQADEFFPLHNRRADQPSSRVERLSPDEGMAEAVEQERLSDGMEETKSMFAQQVSSYDLEFVEEKQFFPNPFQICDVGLPETSGRFRNSDELSHSHISAQFSTLEVEREAAISVGLLVDLGHLGYENRGVRDGMVDTGVSCSDFQDLFDRLPLLKKLYLSREIATQLNCLVCLSSKQMIETTYPNLESLLNHTENSHDLPEVHKCYGLAISQLLGVDLSKFSSEEPNIDDPLGEMPLMNDEGMLGDDDDSIYVSLEEIAINMPEI